jgi:hypothetical protein
MPDLFAAPAVVVQSGCELYPATRLDDVPEHVQVGPELPGHLGPGDRIHGSQPVALDHLDHGARIDRPQVPRTIQLGPQQADHAFAEVRDVRASLHGEREHENPGAPTRGRCGVVRSHAIGHQPHADHEECRSGEGQHRGNPPARARLGDDALDLAALGLIRAPQSTVGMALVRPRRGDCHGKPGEDGHRDDGQDCRRQGQTLRHDVDGLQHRERAGTVQRRYAEHLSALQLGQQALDSPSLGHESKIADRIRVGQPPGRCGSPATLGRAPVRQEKADPGDDRSFRRAVRGHPAYASDVAGMWHDSRGPTIPTAIDTCVCAR